MYRLVISLFALLLLPLNANALNLGEIELHSHLNERLDATVPVSGTPEELKQLTAEIASQADFKKAGVYYHPLMRDIYVSVNVGPKPHIKISSGVAIKEPILELLLRTSWGNGQLLKDFAIILPTK